MQIVRSNESEVIMVMTIEEAGIIAGAAMMNAVEYEKQIEGLHKDVEESTRHSVAYRGALEYANEGLANSLARSIHKSDEMSRNAQFRIEGDMVRRDILATASHSIWEILDEMPRD